MGFTQDVPITPMSLNEVLIWFNHQFSLREFPNILTGCGTSCEIVVIGYYEEAYRKEVK
jgi:hypothetical protein